MARKTTSKPTPRPTSFDVARAAGVSRSSVSLVFTNAGGSRVSAATRERILKAAQDLGYRPNRAASALRKGFSNEIAVIAVEAPTASVTAEWLTSLQERAMALGYSLGIYLFHNLSKTARHSVFASLVSRHPVGIIGSAGFVTREDWTYARKMGVQACVLQGLEPVAFAPTQLIPLKQAVYLAGKHLIQRGHKHIAHIGPRMRSPIEASAEGIFRDGLHSAVNEAGGTVTEFPMNLDLADAGVALDALFASPRHPTAVVGNRDEYCFFLLKALSARGLRVPQDIALVGINDSPFCALSNPALTSVGFDSEANAAHSVEAIDVIVRGKELSPELLVLPPPRLVVRESS